ncbi:gp6-like head-tail connector protein [Paracoccus pantotrophus]|uniref:Gp6-like head-tail connector protein n=1 Tax=Paracoccus pantotrophus TaxID=82367 RepID=A0AAE6NRN4_PARPN|nr:head-tail connector protein [Paracoccus pantotrophus]QFG35316.1 phage gp6-like head-tail connector protein [Paracoccus pantotrophus]RKS44487.1 gp6-like head-tail connector protein [Paracoccus pantotrophus]
MIVPLPDLKDYLRVRRDHEDETIAAIGESAELQVRNWIGRPIYASLADMPLPGAPGYSQYQMVADRAIMVAIMMLAERTYWQRGGEGGASEDAVPPATVRAILSGYRVFHPLPTSEDGA